MKKFNSALSVVISVVLIFSLVVPISAVSVSEDTVSADYKIDNKLKSVIENSAYDDIIPVVLWLSDVDNQERSDLVSAKIRIAENKGELPSKIITNNDLTTLSEDVLTNEDLSEQADVLIELKRDVEKELHCHNNSEVLNSLTASYDNVEEPVFVSNYAPLAIMNMTKDDIENAINNPSIENIYYYEPAPTVEEEDLANSYLASEEEIAATNSTSDNDLYPYGVWQNITSINLLRDMRGFNGSGIKIGLLERFTANFEYTNIDVGDKSRLYEQFAYHIQNDLLHFSESENEDNASHANYSLSILSGFSNNYRGVAPRAEIYCEGRGDDGHYFEPIENLLEDGVNIITASIYWKWEEFNNDYDYVSKFVDYVVSNSDVTMCFAAGNIESGNPNNKLCSAPYSYNVIAVGNIDDNNSIVESDFELAYRSLYNYSATDTYKPDICAPGARASTYVAQNVKYSGNGGTSAACPIVAGICALLMQAHPDLQTKPMLLKSLIMATADDLYTMPDVYSSSTSVNPALNRECGSGMIDAYSAYIACENRDYRHYNVPMSNSYEYNIEVTQKQVNSEKDIYISLNWLQLNTVNGENWNLENNYNVLDGFHHTLSLYDPDGVLVAVSDYQYDRKQFIRYKPLQAGQYTARTTRSYTGSPAYYPAFAVASCIK